MEQQCVEVHLLRCMLRMVDVHHENFGIDNEGKLRIVDFVLPNLPQYNNDKCIHHFLYQQSHMFNNPELYDCLKRVEPGRRKAMAEQAFRRWNLLDDRSPVEQALSELVEEKAKLRGRPLDFYQKSDDVVQLGEAIKNHCQLFRKWLLEKEEVCQSDDVPE